MCIDHAAVNAPQGSVNISMQGGKEKVVNVVGLRPVSYQAAATVNVFRPSRLFRIKYDSLLCYREVDTMPYKPIL